MAHIRCDFKSKLMDMQSSMSVILPDTIPAGEARVVYLLHGLADNCTGWCRYTAVERYALEYNLAVVMPEVQRSFYTDMENGLPYFSFVSEELPALCRQFFGFSRKQDYIMGLSMGGYGAMKTFLSHPERYCGCASLSGVLDIRRVCRCVLDGRKSEFAAIWKGLPKDSDSVFHLLENLDSSHTLSVYLSCGSEDPRVVHSDLFAGQLEKRGFSYRYDRVEGNHDWAFWDAGIKRAFDYFFSEGV